MLPEDRIRLRHMAEAAEALARFVADRQRSDLSNDQMLLFAVVRAIEIIGEAATRITPETQKADPGIPWVRIGAMRNRLIHAYFNVDRDILWRTATEEVPSQLPPLRDLIGRA